jgi:hypothetical protein
MELSHANENTVSLCALQRPWVRIIYTSRIYTLEVK